MKRNVLKFVIISCIFVTFLVTYIKVKSACPATQNTECYSFMNDKACLGGGEPGNCGHPILKEQ